MSSNKTFESVKKQQIVESWAQLKASALKAKKVFLTYSLPMYPVRGTSQVSSTLRINIKKANSSTPPWSQALQPHTAARHKIRSISTMIRLFRRLSIGRPHSTRNKRQVRWWDAVQLSISKLPHHRIASSIRWGIRLRVRLVRNTTSRKMLTICHRTSTIQWWLPTRRA